MSAARRPKTLVVHHRSGIGDLIWHLPYFRAIAATSRDGKISVVARPSCCAADLLSAEPCVAEVIEYDRRPRPSERRRGRHDGLVAQFAFAAELRRRQFDRAVIFSGRVRYALLAWLAGIPERAGFGFGFGERLLLNRPPYIAPHRGPGSWVYPEATAFAIAHGFVQQAAPPRLSIPPAMREAFAAKLAELPQPRYALAIGASEERKRWPPEHFAALAGALAARGASVLLLGGPGDAALAEGVRAMVAARLRERVHPSTQGSVLQTAALLANCDFCVGNDTGVLNIGAAVERRCLGLFGATRPLAHDPQIAAVEGLGMAGIAPSSVLARLEELGAPGFGGADA